MKARLFRLVSFSAAAGLAVFGVMLTLQVRSNLEDRRQTDFEVETSKFTVEVETALTRLQDRIHALVALFETSQEVTEAEFEHFLDVTGMFEETSVLGVAVAPVVKADRVDELNAALARRWESRMLLGYPSLTLTPRGNRSDFMPVVYFESRGLSRDAVGEDLARLPALRLAAERALAGTGPQLSAPQRLAGASDRTPPNMMLIGATEHGRLGLRPDRTDESNPAVIAYDFTPAILIADLFARSRPDRFALQVHDVTGTAPLLVARLEEPAAEERFNHVETIEVAGRRWRLSYMPGPAFVAQGSLIWLYVMSGVALLLLGALAVAVDQLIKRREELARRVEERTAQLVVMNEQLAEAAARANAASDAKSEFLAHMSHELRTPLNALIGFSDLLQSEIHGPLGNPKYGEYARDMRTAGNHLLALISDILDLARVEAGATELEEAEGGVSIKALLRGCERMTRAQSGARDITVRIECPDSLPRLAGDERLLRQILLNLLSNAIRYNRTGGKVVLYAGMEEDGALFLTVADSGIGIAEADKARVLEPFAQAQTAEIAASGGTGLGLALARRFAELHGGTLSIESVVGEGTRVTVRFPRARTILRASTAPGGVSDGASDLRVASS